MPLDKMSSGEEDSGAEEEMDGVKSAGSKRSLHLPAAGLQVQVTA